MSAIGIAVLMYSFMLGVVLIALNRGFEPIGGPDPDHPLIPDETLSDLAICWAAFLVSHVMAFVSMARAGAFKALTSDGRVFLFAGRYPVLFLTALAVAGERNADAPIAPWFFIGSLALMIIVDTGCYVADIDAVNARRQEAIEPA